MPRKCKGRRPLRNEKNRKRNQLLNFHLTPEDKEEIYRRVELSGRTLQDYMTQSALCQQIVVIGNERLKERIENRLIEFEPLLHEIAEGKCDNEVVMKLKLFVMIKYDKKQMYIISNKEQCKGCDYLHRQQRSSI